MRRRRGVRGQRDCRFGKITPVVRLDCRQLHRRQRTVFEESPRRIERYVGTIESDRQKEWLVAPLGDLFNSPRCRHSVAKLIFGERLRPKVPKATPRLNVFDNLLVDLEPLPWTRPDRFKGRPVDARPVVDLAGGQRIVSMAAKVLRQRDSPSILRRLPKPRTVQVDARRAGPQPDHQTGPRRIANGSLTVGVAKQHAALREPIDIRRTRLRMPLQTTNPIIQVVDGNQQHIGPFGGASLRRCDQANHHCQGRHNGQLDH